MFELYTNKINYYYFFQEKMYEFEKNKANNLILYGITTKHPETSDSLKNRIANVFRDHLNIRREITIQKATRVHTGTYIFHNGIPQLQFY